MLKTNGIDGGRPFFLRKCLFLLFEGVILGEMTYAPPYPQFIGEKPCLLFNPVTYELMKIMEGGWKPAMRSSCGICFSDQVEFRLLDMEEEYCDTCGSLVHLSQPPKMSVCLNCFAVYGPLILIPFSTYVFGVRREVSA